jgi:hypothetical protein
MIAALLLAATLLSEDLGTFFKWPEWETNNLPQNIPSFATLGSDDIREMRYTSNLVVNAYATMEGAYERVYYAFCTDANKWDESYYGPRDPLVFLRGATRRPVWDYPTNRVITTRRFIEADNLFEMTKEMPCFRKTYSIPHIAFFQPYHWRTRWPERSELGYASQSAVIPDMTVVWSSSVLGDSFLPSFDWRETFADNFQNYAPMLATLYVDDLFILTNTTYLGFSDRGQNAFIENAFSEVDYPEMTEESPYYGKIDAPNHWNEEYTFATLITNAYDLPLALSITNLTRRIITSRGVTNSFLAAYNQMLGVLDTTFERGVLKVNVDTTNVWHETVAQMDATAVGSVSLDDNGRFTFSGETIWGDVTRTNAMAAFLGGEEGELLRVTRTATSCGASFGALTTNYVMKLSECAAWGTIPLPPEYPTSDDLSAIHISLTPNDNSVNIWWGYETGEQGREVYYPVPTNRLEAFGGVSIFRHYDYRRSCRNTLPPPVYFPPSLQARKTGRVEEFDLAVFSSVATAWLPHDSPVEEGTLWDHSPISKWDSNFRSYWRLNTSHQVSWESATNSVLSIAFGSLRDKMESLARDFYGVDYRIPETMIPIPDGEIAALKNHFSVTGGTYRICTRGDNPLRLSAVDWGDGAISISGWYVYDLDWNPILTDYPLVWLEFAFETNIDGYKPTVKEKDEFAADGKMAIRTRNKWKWKALRREE